MIQAGIIGATGYTGVELLRILADHPGVDVKVATSESESGKNVMDIFPSLRGHVNLVLSRHDNEALQDCELVFFATPNATAMHRVPQFLEAGIKVIDLSADFRIKNPESWTKWYGEKHACPDLLEEAVYGLPEVNRDKIKDARLIANPGCYPTAVILGLLPALQSGFVINAGLIADAKSGISGAGRKASLATQFSEAGETMSAYAVQGHRHQPEIIQALESVTGGSVDLTFVPHLIPMVRGIHATLYAELKEEVTTTAQMLYEDYYQNEHFVDVLPSGTHPDTRSTRGSNYCRIAVHQPQDQRRLVVLSVIDNLVKGAAGQAVQNMNIMYGLHETAGLTRIALAP